MDKRSLSERDICTKFIKPVLGGAGWDEMSQLREEVTFTAGRIAVRGKLVARRLHPLRQAEHPGRGDRGQGQQPFRRRRPQSGEIALLQSLRLFVGDTDGPDVALCYESGQDDTGERLAPRSGRDGLRGRTRPMFRSI